MTNATSQLVEFVSSGFRILADPAKAVPMAAYMKSTMPFYGIQKPERVPIYKEMKKRFTPGSQGEYQQSVNALWQLPHREEKYAALEFARQNAQFINTESLPMFLRLVRQGAWWDFVDDIAINLVGLVLLKERCRVKPIMDKWITDHDFWVRRTAILSHNHHKKQTDGKQLFEHCIKCAPENEFFIRKAIGWALREYSSVEPANVKQFLLEHRSRLSSLSFREGARGLVRNGLMSIS